VVFLPNTFQPVHTNRLVRQSGDAEPMAQTLLRVVHIVVVDGSVSRHSVVPQGDRAFFPADAGLKVVALGDVLRGGVSVS
jgi:hypothetical protein